MTQAVVLAGGLATRLGDLAASTPKYLVPVAGEPFAHHQLRRLAAAGYDEVVICVGHLGAAIERTLGPEYQGLHLVYRDDGPTPLGTGGALGAAAEALDEIFLVTYGDSLLPFDYAAPLADLRAHPEAEASMSVFENRGQIEASNARVDDGWVREYRKGVNDAAFAHIDYGAIALRRSALAQLPQGPSDLSRLFGTLAEDGLMRAVVAPRRFYEIGSLAGLAALEAALAGKDFAR